MSLKASLMNSRANAGGWNVSTTRTWCSSNGLPASVTLKELARDHGISCPTGRLRLDPLIQKVQLLDEHRAASEFEMQPRVLHSEGRLDERVFWSLLAAHRQTQSDA